MMAGKRTIKKPTHLMNIKFELGDQHIHSVADRNPYPQYRAMKLKTQETCYANTSGTIHDAKAASKTHERR
jgi:hypothetical protein